MKGTFATKLRAAHSTLTPCIAANICWHMERHLHLMFSPSLTKHTVRHVVTVTHL